MAASKLAIYNNALGHLGSGKLASLTENREPRRVLDDFYANAVAHCLEKGTWEFATRSAQIDASTSVSPEFGFANSFAKPTDWVRTVRVSASETFDPPLLRFREENSYWEADEDPIYVEYVSNSASLGGLDLSRWTQAFEDYVTLNLAVRAYKRVTGSNGSAQDFDALTKLEKKAAGAAKGLNSAGDPPQAQMGGSWAASRGGNSSNRSRWNRQSF
jgi:hypothetical protein